MSGWTNDMASALPDTTQIDVPPAQAPEANIIDPQAHGWAPKMAYDYESYTKSNKDLMAAQAEFTGDDPQIAVGGLRPGQWHSDAAVYEWKDEYGDVGPEFPELEKQLFGSENHVRSGLNFKAIAELEVIQEGTIRLQPVRRFEDAGLHPVMLNNVKLAGYDQPTPIQQYCLPAVAKGHDIVACAQTGSGKTAAFLIPILSKLMGKAKKLAAPRPNPATYQAGVSPGVRAEPLVLIVCPSRELATQIFDEARRFCYRTMLRPCVVYGGGPIGEQIMSLSKGCDLLIGSPGRLVDFINRPHILTLKRLKYLVIDEADEMLHSDWEAELKQIMSGGDQEEGNINYMMFSATFPKTCRDLAREHLAHEHVRIRVGRAGSSHTNIKQDVVFVEPYAKRQALLDLLLSAPACRTIIFVNSKRAADEVDDFLFNKSFPCTSIHSERTQREREDAIRAFRNGKCPIMIATGVSSRGLDIHNVMHVINFDLPSPQYGGIEEYTHRIGRTGRIGNLGLATSFYNEKDADLAEALVKTLLETHQVIPDFLESFIPEGFTADGTGDVTKLKFDADSDNDEAEESTETGGGWGVGGSAEVGDGWGASGSAEVASGGWGAGGSSKTAGVGWGTGGSAEVAGGGWGAAPPGAVGSWGGISAAVPAAVPATAPAAQVQQSSLGPGWGQPDVQPVARAAPAGNSRGVPQRAAAPAQPRTQPAPSWEVPQQPPAAQQSAPAAPSWDTTGFGGSMW